MATSPQSPRHRGKCLCRSIGGVLMRWLVRPGRLSRFRTSEALRRDAQVHEAQQTGLFVKCRGSRSTSATQALNCGSVDALATRLVSTNIANTLRPVTVLISETEAATMCPTAWWFAMALPPVLRSRSLSPRPHPRDPNFLVRSPGGFAVDDRAIAIGRDGTCIAPRAVVAARLARAGLLELMPAPRRSQQTFLTRRCCLARSGRHEQRANAAPPRRRRQARVRATDLGRQRMRPILGVQYREPQAPSTASTATATAISTRGRPLSMRGPGSWTAAVLLAAPLETLRRIRAVRIGLIARTELPDRSIGDGFGWTLFDCDASDKTKCAGRLTGFIPPDRGGGCAYRVCETVVPLHNSFKSASP